MQLAPRRGVGAGTGRWSFGRSLWPGQQRSACFVGRDHALGLVVALGHAVAATESLRRAFVRARASLELVVARLGGYLGAPVSTERLPAGGCFRCGGRSWAWLHARLNAGRTAGSVQEPWTYSGRTCLEHLPPIPTLPPTRCPSCPKCAGPRQWSRRAPAGPHRWCGRAAARSLPTRPNEHGWTVATRSATGVRSWVAPVPRGKGAAPGRGGVLA